MPALRIPYTITLVTNLGRDPILNVMKRGFVAEFDATLDVEYEDFQNWEVASITFEQTKWNDEFSIDEASDPDFWKLIQRAFEYDWKDLQDKVREFIIEDDANAKYDSAERYSDMSMGR